ncbi:MAG: adenylate/guanylate cyclase domain-containing protein [Saprospiraceae bacterium]|nr:adenylate/guanylate cyclase domain-containing protein [Saprospiraceae bacterium]
MPSKRKLAVIMFTDIVGYSAMMSHDERKALDSLNANRAVHGPLIKQHGGTLLKEMGDGILAAFDSPTDAVLCAGAIHAAIDQQGFTLRIGIHQGEVLFEDGDVFGDGVNIAARIQGLTEPGQTLVSADVYRNVKNKPGIRTTSVGEHPIKGFSEPVSLYDVVSDSERLPGSDPVSLTEPKHVRPIKNSRRRWMTGVILLLVMAGLALYKALDRGKEGPSDTSLTMAVLRLINLSEEGAELQYLADGITQELIEQLAKVNSLTVRPFSLIYPYEPGRLPLVQIANELDVQYLITGSMGVFHDSVRLSIELVNPHSNDVLWNGSYHLPMMNAPSLQVQVATMVNRHLNISLSPGEAKAIAEVGTTNGVAFDLFWRAWNEISKVTGEGFLNARRYLDDALKLDAEYAQAHTLMAWSYALEQHPMFSPNPLPSDEIVSLAMPHIERSIALDPESSDIYLVRGNVHKNYTLRLDQAKRDIDRAIAMNSWPKVPTSYCTCTILSTYIANGRYQEAMRLAGIAAGVEPDNFVIYSDQGIILTMLRQFSQAQQKLDTAAGMMDIPYVNFYLGSAYYHDKQYLKAIEHYEKARFASDSSILSFAAAYLTGAYLMVDDQLRSDQYRRELEAQVSAGLHHRNHAMALLHALLGEEEEMLIWLERAHEQKDGDLGSIMSELAFEPYRDNPGFQAILQRMRGRVD